MFEEHLESVFFLLLDGNSDCRGSIFVGEVEVGSFLDEEVGDLMALIADGRHESGPSL